MSRPRQENCAASDLPFVQRLFNGICGTDCFGTGMSEAPWHIQEHVTDYNTVCCGERNSERFWFRTARQFSGYAESILPYVHVWLYCCIVPLAFWKQFCAPSRSNIETGVHSVPNLRRGCVAKKAIHEMTLCHIRQTGDVCHVWITKMYDLANTALTILSQRR